MAALPKRSFVELPLVIDREALLREVEALPAGAWRPTYWGTPHCSIASILLRGGTTGTQADYCCEEVDDAPTLHALPAITALIGPTGPFGGCQFAFLFRMAPGGVTLAHYDGAEVWHRLHRVHVPLSTHPDAKLVVEGRVHHLAAGRAWTFDNQALHGFSNGPCERVHLILDVPDTEVMRGVLAGATVHPGTVDPVVAARTLEVERAVASYPGDGVLRGVIVELREAGWSDEEVAGWLTEQGVVGPLAGAQWTGEVVQRVR
jgi:hypothetical protein